MLSEANGLLEGCLFKKNSYSSSACLSGFRGGKGCQDIAAVDSLRVVVYLRG